MQFSAKQSQGVLFLTGLSFRNGYNGAVAARISNQCKTNAGIAGRAFNYHTAWLQFTALLGVKNDVFGRPVFYRTARVHEFGLAENGTAGQLGSFAQMNQGCIADGVG